MEDMKTYNIVIDYDNDDERMIRNSFVEQPAVEIEKFAFSKDMMKFNKDEKRQCFMSVSILADTPIPRMTKDGKPFNVVFTKEVIRVIANKLVMENRMNEVSWQHSNQMIEGVYLVEQFISEKDRVYSPKFNVPEGSLIQTYWVKDKNMYEKLSNDSSFQGFSIEIEATIEEAFGMDFSEEVITDSIKDILFSDLSDDEKYDKINDILKNH
jgi:hypothetical protein